jgi:hypothetical protein
MRGRCITICSGTSAFFLLKNARKSTLNFSQPTLHPPLRNTPQTLRIAQEGSSKFKIVRLLNKERLRIRTGENRGTPEKKHYSNSYNKECVLLKKRRTFVH